MTPLEYLLTYTAVPLGAVQFYARLRRRMSAGQVGDPPGLSLPLVLTVYGGWLTAGYVALLGAWSAAMNLVLLYLLLAGPVLMLVVSVGLYPRRHLSGYHYGAMVAAAAYAGAAGVVVGLFALLFVLAVLAGGLR